MAITAISAIKADWYTPESERDEEETKRTRFKLQPLDGTQYLDVMAQVNTTPNGDIQMSGYGLRMAAKWGVVGWENFADPETGKEMKFNAFTVARIPPVILKELVSEIMDRSELGEIQVKNS